MSTVTAAYWKPRLRGVPVSGSNSSNSSSSTDIQVYRYTGIQGYRYAATVIQVYICTSGICDTTVAKLSPACEFSPCLQLKAQVQTWMAAAAAQRQQQHQW